MKDAPSFERLDRTQKLLFTAAAALLVITLAFTYVIGAFVVRANKSMASEQEVIQTLEEITSSLKDAETGQRGYLLTGKDSYLEPYRTAVRQLAAEQRRLHQLVANDTSLASDIKVLDQHIAAKMSELDQTIDLRPTNAAAAAAIVQSDRGKSEMDQIRILVTRLTTDEQMRFQQVVERSTLATHIRTTAFIFTGLLNLAFLGWIYRRLSSETERSRVAAATLEQTRERLQNMIDSISDGLMVLDRDWRMTFLSAQGAKILGVNQADMMGKNIWDTLPQGRERKSCPEFKEAMEQRKSRHFEEHYALNDQWLEIHCYPSQEGLTVYFHDITERKRAEQILSRSREELEKLVAERTAKLQELVAELEHFSYTITHDMRSPLRAMTGFAQVLEELGDNCPSEQRKHFLARISSAARRMDLLIADALNYNRAVREELPLEPVDVGALIRGMVDTYPEFQPTKAQITIEGQIPDVMGNEAGLTQCFSNLIGNATKFVKPGQKPNVRIRAEHRGDWIRIWVEDEGIGIPESVLPRVFDMFTRGQSDYEGTGIGLALVRKVVDRMGGRVGAQSEQGVGTKFWIELKPVKTLETTRERTAKLSAR